MGKERQGNFHHKSGGKPIHSRDGRDSRSPQQTFILEPIWTPSGLVDGGDDTPNPVEWDVNTLSLDEVELPDEDSWGGADDIGFKTNGSTQREVGVDEGDYIVANSLLDTSSLDDELQEIPFITSVDEATDGEPTGGVTNIVHDSTEGELSGEGNDSVETLTANEPADEKASEEIAYYELTSETEAIASEQTGDELAEDNIDPELSDKANESEDEQLVLALDSPSPTYEGGIFTVGETGEISIEFLYDGGKYKGELAIFSLDGMDEFELGSEDFIQEAASRALSDSELGHVVISDPTEGAKFSGGWLGESDRNAGEYLGAKTFAMRPGDKFGFMLVPNGQVQQVFDNPEVGGAIRPLFSLASANPEDAFHVGQIADVTGDGNTFVMEDLRVDTGSDLDYDDLIFRVEGAKGEAASLDDVIDLDHDWRDTALGKELLDYAASFLEPDDPIIVLVPEGQTQIDLELLFPDLPEEESWVFEILDEGTQNLDPQIEGEDALIVQTQPDADIDRIAVQATNDQGDRYVQRPILVAKGPDLATTELVTDLLDDFGEVFEELSDTTDSEGTEELSALVDRLDSLIEEQPKTLKFLIKPELLEALDFESSQVDTAYQVIHSESVGQLLGLQVSLHEALTGSDPGAWEQLQVEAHDLPSVTEGDDEFPFVGFIDFTAQEHDENTVGIFKSIDGLAEQEYSLIHADDGDWAEQLTELVDEAKGSDASGAVINLSFDLTQVDDQGRVTTRYELTPEEQVALQYTQDNNVLIVVSAGNTGDKMSALGKAAELFSNLLVVGAVNRWEEKADYSAQGNSLSLVAPGGQWESDPEAFVGTSKAAAYVTAGASRIWAANPDLNYQQIKRIILDTADDLAEPGWDSQTGAGLLDIEEAILTAKQTQGQPVANTTTPPITPYSGEGRVSPHLRPNASNAVRGALESLEASQAQILNEWDQLRQLGSSDVPIEDLAQALQTRTDTTLDLYQELTTLAAVAAAAEQQELEKYTLLDEQWNLRSQKIAQLEQQLAELEFQKSQLAQIIDSAPQEGDNELEQELQKISEDISSIEESLSIDKEPISYEAKSINGHNIKEETIYIKEIEGPFGIKIPLLVPIAKKIYTVEEPKIRTHELDAEFTKTTTFREAEQSEIEALELKADFIEDQQILNDQIQAFEREKLLSTGKLLTSAIESLREEINSEQKKLDELNEEKIEISDRLNLLRGQLDTSIKDIQEFLNVLGLGLPAEQLKEEFEAVNERIEERLNSIELNPEALDKLRKIRSANSVKIAVLDDSQLQEVIQSQEFNTLIDTISAEELEQFTDYLKDEATGGNGQNTSLTQSGQALSSLLAPFAGNKTKLLEVLEFIRNVKGSRETLNSEQLSWQSQEAQFESRQNSYLETIQSDSLVEGALVETLSELVNRKKVLNLLSQLNSLVTEEIKLAAEEDDYHEQAASVSDDVWYTDGAESVYNASQAAQLLSYQQSASEIAHQRNLNWQARKSILDELSQLDLDVDVQDIDKFADPSQQTQLINWGTTQEELIKQLEVDLLEQVSVTAPDATQKLASLQSFEADFGELTTTAQEFTNAVTENIPSLVELVEFGTIASIFDVDFFENYVEPKIWDTQFSLEQQQQAITEKLSESKQVLEILVENTASAEEIEFLKNPELQDGEIPPELASVFEEKETYFKEVSNTIEKLTNYIQNLEQSKADIESTIASLTSSLSQAGISLAILRQKQEYEFRQQVERNQEVLELFRSQATAEANINEGSILSYAKVQDQLREEIRKSILNDSEALTLENSIRKEISEQWANYQEFVDSTILFVEENLAEPHSQHQGDLKDYDIALTTLDAQTDAEIQGQKVINNLSLENQRQRFEIDNESDFWKEIAFLLDRYEFEVPELESPVDETIDLEALKELLELKANTPELLELKELQLAFIQHPEVVITLTNLLQQKHIRFNELLQTLLHGQHFGISTYQPDLLTELKQVIDDRNELSSILGVIGENLPENSEQGTLTESLDRFFSRATEFSSSYVDWLNQRIAGSQYDGTEAAVYEISKSFALPSVSNTLLNALDISASEHIAKISENLNKAKAEVDDYWSQARASYIEAYLAKARKDDLIKRSEDDFVLQLKKFLPKKHPILQSPLSSFSTGQWTTERLLRETHKYLAPRSLYDEYLSSRHELIFDGKTAQIFVENMQSGINHVTRAFIKDKRGSVRYRDWKWTKIARVPEGGGNKWYLGYKTNGINGPIVNAKVKLSASLLDSANRANDEFLESFQAYESNLSSYARAKRRVAILQAEYERWVGKDDADESDRFTLKAIGEAQAGSNSVETYLGDLLVARKSIPERHDILDDAELELDARQQELNDIKTQIATSELQLDDEWNEYGISAAAYLASLQTALVERGKPDREAVELQGNLWELDGLLEDRILTLSTAVDNAEALVKLLTQELGEVTQQIADAPTGEDLAVLTTKQAQLQNNLELATLHHQALKAQQEALAQKRHFVAVLHQGTEASQHLIDAYFKSPDPDAEALKSLLLQIQESISEADRLAKEAEERSKEHQLSLENWEETHLAQQDEVLQQAQRQRELIGTLAAEVERKYNLVSETVLLYQELNGVLNRIIDLLKKAGEEGNRQADLLRQVAFENRLEVISEVRGINYTDLSENERKELKELAKHYVEQAWVHSQKRQAVQNASDQARFARLTAEAALDPRILVRNPYQEKFKEVEVRIHDALFEDEDERLQAPKEPADFLRQAARLKLYFDWLETELENKIILQKALQYRKRDIQAREFAKTSTILELALKERWQELSAENSIDLTQSEYVEQNLPRYKKEFKDENTLDQPPFLLVDFQDYMAQYLEEIDTRLQDVEGDIEDSLPSQKAEAEAYQDWIYGYQNDDEKWVYGQIQITESEKEQIQTNLGLSNKQVEQNKGVRHQADVVRAEIADKTDEIDKASGNIEALQRELRLAEVRRDGLEENLALIEQFRTGLLSWEFVYISQAQLVKTLAEENQDDLEIAKDEWIEREMAAIDRQRWDAAAAIVGIQQQGAEYDWQTALNSARAELGLVDLKVVTPPDKTKLAELLAHLEALETEQVDLPIELKSLMAEVQGQLHSALQGEKADNLSDRLFEMIERFGEQVAAYQAAIEDIDKEIEADSQLLGDLDEKLTEAVKQLNAEAKESQELQDQINELDAELRAAWDRITSATEDVILSEIEAKNLKDWIEKVIEQRIKERKARRRARWFKAFGIIAMIIAAVATIVTLGGGSVLLAGVLGLVAAGIQATMAGINKDWFGVATSVIQAVLNFVPALGTVLDSAGKPLVAASVASSIKNYGGALVSAIQSGKAFASGNELLGILETFAIFSALATEGLTQSIKNGATELTKNAHRMIQDVLDTIKEVPKKIYQGVEGIKSGDVLSAINGFFNAVITLGSKITGHVSDTLTDVTDWLGKAGNTALIVANFVKNGGIFPVDQLLNIFEEDLKDLFENYEKGQNLEEANKILEISEDLPPERKIEYLKERLKEVSNELASEVVDKLDSTREQIEIVQSLSSERQHEVFHGLSQESKKEWAEGFTRSQLQKSSQASNTPDSPTEPPSENGSSEEPQYGAIAIVDAPSFWERSADFIAGALAGEFNRDPSFGQVLVRGLAEMIPGAGVPLAIQDIAAISERFITDPEEIKKPENWIGLGDALLSAIPLVPGSLLGKLFKKIDDSAFSASGFWRKPIKDLPEEDWTVASGILRDASRKSRNVGLDDNPVPNASLNYELGKATEKQIDAAGRAWVGEGARLSSNGKAWVSSDGLRQYRPPTFKPNQGKYQANFESRYKDSGRWITDGHVDLIEE